MFQSYLFLFSFFSLCVCVLCSSVLRERTDSLFIFRHAYITLYIAYEYMELNRNSPTYMTQPDAPRTLFVRRNLSIDFNQNHDEAKEQHRRGTQKKNETKQS